MSQSLVEKYNVPVPRYTSFPTVPQWSSQQNNEQEWIHHLDAVLQDDPEISLYVHLPFCEQLCTYCGCNKRITTNHAVEQPYLHAVLLEWDHYLESLTTRPIIKELHLGGGTPTFFSPDHLSYLVSSLINRVTLATDAVLSFEAHPASTSKAHLERLYALGFRRVSIGVQDISPDILKAINRSQTADDITRVTQQARSIGYTSVNYDIIYGLPFQRPLEVMHTFDFIGEHMPDRIAFYSYAHVPWKSRGQRAFTIENIPAGIHKNDLYNLGKMMMDDLGYKQVGMDHFVLPHDDLYLSYAAGEMHRNFMGYTALHTQASIGLGASAISDSYTMFVQNEPHVETYQDRILDGALPMVKSHTLTPDEKIIRRHMLRLMCQDYTYWSTLSRDHELIKHAFTRLFFLKEDGLIDFTSNSISVTELGRYFIRNICAAIDPYLSDADASSPIYSQAI